MKQRPIEERKSIRAIHQEGVECPISTAGFGEKQHLDGESAEPREGIGRHDKTIASPSFIYRSGGVEAGGRRWRVACSYEYASRMSVVSDHARPKKVRPAGSRSPSE